VSAKWIFEVKIFDTLVLLKEFTDFNEMKRFSADHSAKYKCDGYVSDYTKELSNMQTIELSLEEIKDKLREGHIFSGVDIAGNKVRFMYDNWNARIMCLSTFLGILYCKSDLLEECLECGKLYWLDDPIMEAE